MRIGIGNDHHGLETKSKIVSYLNSQSISYIDYGTNTKDNTDYVDYAEKVCEGILNGEVDRGILICKTGIGMSIAANKISGIRCARVLSKEDTYLTRKDNDANMISIPSSVHKEELIKIVETFINTSFSDEERHVRRIDKINNL